MPFNRFVNREYYNPEKPGGLLLWQRIVNGNETRKKYVIQNGENVVEQEYPDISNATWSIAQYPELLASGNWLPVTLYGISAGGINGFGFGYDGVYTGGSGATYLGRNLMLRIFDDSGNPIEYEVSGWGAPQAPSISFTTWRWAPEGDSQSGTLNDTSGFQFRNKNTVVVDGITILAKTPLLAMSRGRSEQIGGAHDGEAGGVVLITPGSSGELLRYGPNTVVSQNNGRAGYASFTQNLRRSPIYQFSPAEIAPINNAWLPNTFQHGLSTANKYKISRLLLANVTVYKATFGSLTMVLGE